MGLIRTGSNWTEDSAHLACSHAATLNDDDFELDEDTGQVKTKNNKWDFMKKVEDCIDRSDKVQQDRFDEMKKMILEQMKKTIRRKMELRGEKRGNEDASENSSTQSKPRIKSPPKV